MTIKKAESWRIETFKLWCWRRLESSLNSKEIKPVNPKGNQPWIFIGRTNAEAEAPIFWPLDSKNWLIGKDPDPGKDWRQEEKGMTEDNMVGLHHWLNGHELSKLWEMVKEREAWRAAVHGITKSWTWLSSWTTKISFKAWIQYVCLLLACPRDPKNRFLFLPKWIWVRFPLLTAVELHFWRERLSQALLQSPISREHWINSHWLEISTDKLSQRNQLSTLRDRDQ